MSLTNNDTYGLSLRHTLQGHTQEVNRIAWSFDGHLLASSSFDGTVRLWDVQTGLSSHIIKEHSGPVYSVAWSSNNTLASCSKDEIIVIYNASFETFQVEHFERAHHGNIYDLAWSSGGWMFASCSEDHTIRTWTPPSHRPIIHNGHSSDVFCVAWQPQGNEIFASGSSGGPIRLWDTSTMIKSQYVRSL